MDDVCTGMMSFTMGPWLPDKLHDAVARASKILIIPLYAGQ